MDILDWYKKNNRSLPWRGCKEPYKVWLSEIILQQTRVTQGEAYFNRFVAAFPTIQELANAKEIEVLKLWEGLGYYSRARNLHHTSQIISKKYNGKFPNSFSDLIQLKGIGKYTAAAIASICFQEVVPAIDGNAYRVYSRFFGIFEDVSKSSSWKAFYKIAEEVIDKKNPGDFNQAIMDLGASICKPKKPDCLVCPINGSCYAFGNKKLHLLPVNNKKIKTKDRVLNYFFIEKKNKFYVQKRGEKDIWKNLYELPLLETSLEQLNHENSIHEMGGFRLLLEKKHLLTHQNLFIYFWLANENDLPSEILKNSILVSKTEIYQLPYPRPILDFLHKMIPIS